MNSNAPQTPHPGRRIARRRERGSAYLIVLFLLVLITVFGLSLSVITQTESQIGASERVATRNFFAVESGIAIAVARKQVTNLEAGRVFDTLDAHTSSSGVQVANRITLSPLVTVSEAPCNLCSINDRQGDEYKQIEYAQNITAERIARQGSSSASVIALKQTSVVLGRQPTTSSIGALLDLQQHDDARRNMRY